MITHSEIYSFCLSQPQLVATNNCLQFTSSAQEQIRFSYHSVLGIILRTKGWSRTSLHWCKCWRDKQHSWWSQNHSAIALQFTIDFQQIWLFIWAPGLSVDDKSWTGLELGKQGLDTLYILLKNLFLARHLTLDVTYLPQRMLLKWYH